MKTTRRRKSYRQRAMTPAEKKRWNAAADTLLERAYLTFNESSMFDTAVRDSISEGLAYLVHAAFDCRACAMEFKDTESWIAFIEGSTAQWFRDRGYVEWFCAAAASQFRTSRPRTLQERTVAVKRRRAV